jgi:hypothetical protein
MRYPASEKVEIIKLVEGSPLPAKATLAKLGHPASHLLPLVRPIPAGRSGGTR